METQQQSKIRGLFPIFSESITLAFATAGLYAVAFAYEAGYLTYFEIPTHLVRPSITTLVLSVIACATALLSTIKFLNFLTPLFNILVSDKHAKWRTVIFINCLLLIPILFVIAIYPWSWILSGWMLGILTFINFLYIGIPIILNYFFKSEPSVHLAIEKSLDNDPLSILQWLSNRGAMPYLNMFFIFIITIGLGWAVGNSKAMKEDTFDVLIDLEPMIMVRSYDQYILFKPIDIKNKTFDRRFRIIPLEGVTQDFEHTKLGQFKLDKNIEQLEE